MGRAQCRKMAVTRETTAVNTLNTSVTYDAWLTADTTPLLQFRFASIFKTARPPSVRLAYIKTMKTPQLRG